MRNSVIVCTCIALSLLLTSSLFAQKNVVKFNPGSLLLLTGSGAYERAITDKVSVQLGGYYTGFTLNGDWLDGNEIGYKVWAITPEARFYPLANQTAPNGLFVGPFARVRRASIMGSLDFTLPDGTEVMDRGEVSIRAIGGGAVIGYQAIVLKHLSLEAFAGPGIYGNRVRVKTQGTLTDEVQAQIDEIHTVSGGLTTLIPNYRGPRFGATVGMRAGITVGFAF